MQIEERLGVEVVTEVIMNSHGDGIEEYESLVAALYRNEYHSTPKKLKLDMKHRDSPPARPTIVEAPKLELKAIPHNLRYVFLGRFDTLPIIIASELNGKQVECLAAVLKRFK